MLRCWGGPDDYTFHFVPQDPKVQILLRDPEDIAGGDGNNNESQIANRNPGTANGFSKKVRAKF